MQVFMLPFGFSSLLMESVGCHCHHPRRQSCFPLSGPVDSFNICVSSEGNDCVNTAEHLIANPPPLDTNLGLSCNADDQWVPPSDPNASTSTNRSFIQSVEIAEYAQEKKTEKEGFENTDEEVELCYEDAYTKFLKFGEFVNFQVVNKWHPHLLAF